MAPCDFSTILKTKGEGSFTRAACSGNGAVESYVDCELGGLGSHPRSSTNQVSTPAMMTSLWISPGSSKVCAHPTEEEPEGLRG